MATPEIQKNAPAGAPVSKPSDALLKSFRLTIQQRWQEFDTATMNEARKDPKARFGSLLGMASEADIRAGRDKDAKFLQAKATFDKAIIAINSISTDEDLKKILATPGNFASSINDLKEYLAQADAQIEYNAVLSHTFADLTDLRAKVTESPLDKKEAELAQAAIPTLAVATGAGALTADAMSGFSGALKESTAALGKEAAAIKESPLKKIVELFGFTESSILSKYRGALAEKKTGGLDGVFATIKIWFYEFLAKIVGADITKDLTPEELELAGIKPKEGQKPALPAENKEAIISQAEKIKNETVVRATSGFFLRRIRAKEYDGFWSASFAGIKNATWGKDEKNRKAQMEDKSTEMLGWPNVSTQKVSTLLSMNNDTDPDITLGLTGTKELEKGALRLAIYSLVKNETFIQGIIGEKYPNWKDLEVSFFLREFYTYTGLVNMERLSETIKSVNWSVDSGSISQTFKKLAISKDPNTGNLTGYLGEKISALSSAGLDNDVITRIILPGEEGGNTIENYRVVLKNKPYKKETHAAGFLDALTEKGGFSKNVIEMMNAIGLEMHTGNLENGEKLQIEELLKIYIISGGQTDISKLTLAQQTEVIPMLYSIAGRLNPGILGAQSFVQLITGSTNPYIKKMSEFVGNAVTDATYISVLGTMGFVRSSAEGFLSLRETNPSVFYGTISAVVLSVGVGVYIRKPLATAVLSATIITIGAKLAGLTMISNNN